MSNDLAAAYAHCGALLRAGDRDLWLCSLFAPASKRPHLHALHAFTLEIAAVQERVSQPMPGEIRLQWWRDALEGTSNEAVSANPVAMALLDTLQRFRLPQSALIDLLDARVFDLYHDPMPDVAALEAWCGAVFAAPVRLACLILADGRDPGGAAACGHAGMALGLARLLCDLPIASASGRLYLPADVLVRHGLEPADMLARKIVPGMAAALAEYRELARYHLNQAHRGRIGGDASIGAAFLPLALVEPLLRRMEKPAHDPFNALVLLPHWRRQLAIWRASQAG